MYLALTGNGKEVETSHRSAALRLILGSSHAQRAASAARSAAQLLSPCENMTASAYIQTLHSTFDEKDSYSFYPATDYVGYAR